MNDPQHDPGLIADLTQAMNTPVQAPLPISEQTVSVSLLLGRLRAVRENAQSAVWGPWYVGEDGDEVRAWDGLHVADGFALSGPQLRATTRHIAQQDPVRVGADAAALERIVGLCLAAEGAAGELGQAILAELLGAQQVVCDAITAALADPMFGALSEPDSGSGS